MRKKNEKENKFNPSSRKEEIEYSVEEFQTITEIAYLREQLKVQREEIYHKEKEYQKIARHVFILGFLVGMILSVIIGVIFL